MIEFNKDADSVLEGFGVTEDRFNEIAKPLKNGVFMEVIDSSLKDESLSIEEKISLIFELGISFGEQACIRRIYADQVPKLTQRPTVH